jgi:hypothetical protein
VEANKKRKKRKRGEKKGKRGKERGERKGEERREFSYCYAMELIGSSFWRATGHGGPRGKFRPSGGPSVSNLVYLYHITIMRM